MLAAIEVHPPTSYPPLGMVALAGFVAVAVMVALATARKPSLGIAALLASGPFALYRSVGPTTLTLGKAALAGALVGLLFHPRSLAVLGERPVRGALLALGAVGLATAIGIHAATDRGAAVRETLKALQYLAVFAAAALAWRSDPDHAVLRVATLATVLAVCAGALWQEVSVAPAGVWYGGHPYPRIAGALEGPNQLAGYLGLLAPLIALWALGRDALARTALALATATAVLTLSRAGLVAYLVALLVVLVARRGAGTRAALTACGVGMAAAACVIASWRSLAAGSRFFSISEIASSGGVGTRAQLWHAALVLWRAHPLWGIGPGNFEEAVGAYAAGVHTHANSWYLQALVEGGLPLLAATLALVAIPIVGLARARANPLALAALAASVGFALHGILDLMWFYPKVTTTWMVLLALGLVAARERTP